MLEDLSTRELLGIAPLLAVIVFFGVYPSFMIDRIEPSVDALISVIEADDLTFDEAEPTSPERSGAEGLTESLEEAEAKKEAKEETDELSLGADSGSRSQIESGTTFDIFTGHPESASNRHPDESQDLDSGFPIGGES